MRQGFASCGPSRFVAVSPCASCSGYSAGGCSRLAASLAQSLYGGGFLGRVPCSGRRCRVGDGCGVMKPLVNGVGPLGEGSCFWILAQVEYVCNGA